MRFRFILVLGLALGFTATGCDKKEEEAAKAAAESAKAQAAQTAAKADEAVKNAAAQADEAVKKATAEAEEAVKKAKEEADSKLKEAEAAAKTAAETAAAAAAQAAAAEATAAATAKLEAEAAAKAEAEKATLLEQKDVILQLAVDIGCLKKKETDAQKMIKEEEQILGAAEMDQRAFLNAFEALKAADETFTVQITNAVEACPSAEDVVRSKVIGVQVLNTCLRQAKVKPERMGSLQAEILQNYELTAEEFTALRDKYKDEPWFKPSLEEGTKSCPPLAEEDMEAVGDEDAAAPKGDRKPAARPNKQALRGTVFGSANGKISVALEGKRIRSGTMTLGDVTLRLSGYIMDNGKITFKGVDGPNSVRGFGKFERASRILGNWNATIKGQRKSGSFILHR